MKLLQNNYFKKVPSTLGVNLFNFTTKILLTFIFGDFLGFDVQEYYIFVLIYLFFQGYYLHSKYNFKNHSRDSFLKYGLHTLLFSTVDYFLFNYFVLLFDTYQFVVNILSSIILWFVRYTSLRYLVFSTDHKNTDHKNANYSNSDIQKNHYDSNAQTKVKRDLNPVSSKARKEFACIPLNNLDSLGKLMDFGCGNGALVDYLSGHYESYEGYDISFEQVKNANFYYSNKKNVEFSVKNLKEPFQQSNIFDTVYSFGVLHHMTELNDIFKNIDKVLKVGGKCIIVEPHKGGFFINSLRNIRKIIDKSYDETQFFFKQGEIESLVPSNLHLVEQKFFGFLLPYFAHFPLKPKVLFLPLLNFAITVDNLIFNKSQKLLKNYLWMQYLIYEKKE